MVEGGPIDVLTGDWLAELTMLILSRIRAKRPGSGYARTFVGQMEDVMGGCLDRGIKVVSNAGGLDPDGCADAVKDVADKLGLSPTIAWVDGDDLMSRVAELAASGALQPFPPATDLGDPADYLTANAYLGCWGIVEALERRCRHRHHGSRHRRCRGVRARCVAPRLGAYGLRPTRRSGRGRSPHRVSARRSREATTRSSRRSRAWSTSAGGRGSDSRGPRSPPTDRA